ncbi:MAG: ABC transporter ATP-binding protein [Vulcanimicrobiota bacterium]
MAGELAIRLQQLTKTYRTRRGQVEALRGLDLEVRVGEIFGYIGVNGAGKSTSIKILLGLSQATSGQAEIFGEPAGTLAARSKVGYLPEVATYHEFMTVEELLRIHARLAGVPDKMLEERCRVALESVKLDHRRRSRISELSKGLKQRFGVAQALVGDPPLLILDELTSGLDPFAQRDLRDILVALRARNITVFFSSHYMSEVEAVCDRAAIIHNGQLQVCGTIPELTENREKVELVLQASPQALAELPNLEPVSDEVGELHRVSLNREEADAYLARCLALGCSVRRLNTVQHSLEDVFYQITRPQGSKNP